MPDIVAGNSSILGTLTSFAVGKDFIVVVALGIAGDDVPSVEEAGNIAEHT